MRNDNISGPDSKLSICKVRGSKGRTFQDPIVVEKYNSFFSKYVFWILNVDINLCILQTKYL